MVEARKEIAMSDLQRGMRNFKAARVAGSNPAREKNDEATGIVSVAQSGSASQRRRGESQAVPQLDLTARRDAHPSYDRWLRSGFAGTHQDFLDFICWVPGEIPGWEA